MIVTSTAVARSIGRLVLLASLALASGCVAPGSAAGRVTISGQIIDPAGAAVANEKVQIVLPATYGLGGLDLVLNDPEDFGHEDQLFAQTTDADGRFEQDIGQRFYHVSVWLLPPLGAFPRRPPAPFIFVRLPGRGNETYAIQTWDGEYRVIDAEGEILESTTAPVSVTEAIDTEWESEEFRGTKSELQLQVQ